MKRQKRLAAALLCLCMALSLAACGGSGGGGKEPVPLSKFVSKGTHIAYLDYVAMTKDGKPDMIVLFEDGKYSVLRHTPKINGEYLTYKKMSEMTDKEIAEVVHADPEVLENCSYFLYMRTDASGNTPVLEGVRLVPPGDGPGADVFINVTKGVTTQTIYDDVYTIHGMTDGIGAWSVRGAGFTCDTPGTKDILMDPSSDEIKAMIASLK